MLRKNYLKEHKQWYYQSMVLSGKLNEHLNMVDKEAHEMVELLIKQMTAIAKHTIFLIDQFMAWKIELF